MLRFPLGLALLVSTAPFAVAAAPSGSAAGGLDTSLPFQRTVINRYSLDDLPRSLSIRQGHDVWFGYDLERGALRKVWQAPAGKPGVITTHFVTRSAGTVWFEDASTETWQLQRPGKIVPLKLRYQGCAQRETHFELTWELQHDAGTLTLRERIPRAGATTTAGRAVRELRVEHLAAGEALLPPSPARTAWQLSTDGVAVTALTGTAWHHFTLR